VVNSKVYMATRILSFIANYRRELRMGMNIRRKEKVEKVTEFAERMKKIRKSRGSIKEGTRRDKEASR